ncbi:MAG: esterase family protein [Clostridiales bacterium]|nr:esterase family protein [Clostridiales bacterium]
MALLHVDFFSNVLGMCMQMDVILPQRTKGQIGAEGKGSKGEYPTLYLLHGMSDDSTVWQRRTSIERYADDMGIAVVMPTTHLGWYTDMHHGLKYWTFISEELQDICHDFFPKMSTKREDNFVAGLSMGGYGAMKMGLGAAERFCAVASLSGAMDVRHLDQNDSTTHEFWFNIFGPLDKVEGSDNDLFELASRLKASGKPLPKLYMWCGTEDFLYEANKDMKKHLTDLGYDLTYEETPGDHQWKYWDDKIQDVLRWLPIRK